MEKIIEYLFVNLEINRSIAPILAFIVAVLENKSKGLKDCIIVSLLAIGIAGTVEDYLPEHTLFMAICVGILSGISTDDLHSKFTNKFPTFIDDVFNALSNGIKTFLNRFLGNKDE